MAANRIKGITIEIGGDTTKLQTALKGVNTQVKSTQQQLKDMEKLLKLDPDNTELLAQKHRLLGEAVAAYDGMHVFGKDILILETYDTTIGPIDLTPLVEIKSRYVDLPDRTAASGWEKDFMLAPCLSKEGRGIGEKNMALSGEWLSEYLRLFANAPKCTREEKRKKIKRYTDNLFKQGGVAVNQFKKMLGEEKATELLGQYIFSNDAP